MLSPQQVKLEQISRSNGGYKIESKTPMGSGESRGEGAAHEWGSARVKAKSKESIMMRRWGGEREGKGRKTS